MSTIQHCTECGTRGEPGQAFCDACGAVLSWTEPVGARPSARATTAQPQPRPQPQPQPRQADGPPPLPRRRPDDAPPAPPVPPGGGAASGEVEKVGGRGGGGNDTEGGGEGGADVDDSQATRATRARGEGAGGGHADAATMRLAAVTPSPTPDTVAHRARRLVVPVADPTPPATPPTVAPTLPGRTAATRPQVRRLDPEPGADGGVPCPWCAVPNRPDRHFCARCAMPMAGQSQRAQRPSWWRRLLDRRGREAPWAGDRPRLRRTFGHILRWVVAALVVAALIAVAVHVPDGVRATRDHFAKRAPVAPDGYSASRSFPKHPARLAFDRLSNTWWGPGVSHSGTGQWLQARFERPTRLLDLVITPGVSTHADELSEQAQPHRIEARITTDDGTVTTREIVLDQGPGGQRRAFRADNVTEVRFTIQSAYGAAPRKQVAIAEIEFFGPSASGGS